MKKFLKKYKFIILLLILTFGVFSITSVKNNYEQSIKIEEKSTNKIEAKYYEDGSLDLRDFLKNAYINDMEKNPVKEVNQVSNLKSIIEDVEVEFEYEIPLSLLYKEDKWDGRVKYELASDIIANYPSVNGEVRQGDVIVGSYVINEGVIDIQFFEEQLSEGTAVVGDFYFWADLDYSDLEYSGEKLFEFSNNVSVRIQFNLYTELLINKESVSAVANYDDNFVDFSYKVEISSPAGTNGKIAFNDVISQAYDSDSNDELKSLSIKMIDKDKKESTIDSNLLSYNADSNNIIGELDVLESGSKYVIEYVISEKVDFDYYGEISQDNVVKASLESGIEVSDSSTNATFFEGVRYDLSVDKVASFDGQEDTKVNFSYVVTISSKTGTYGKNIEVRDKITKAYASAYVRIGYDYTLKKVSSTGVTTDLRFEDYTRTYSNKLSTASGNVGILLYYAILPPLEANEKYVIQYKVYDYFANADIDLKNVGYDNVVTVTSGNQTTSDSVSINRYVDFGPDLSKSLSDYSCTDVECTINWNIKLYNRNLADNTGFDLDLYSIDDSISKNSKYNHVFDGEASVLINYSDGSSQNISGVFPFSIEQYSSSAYFVDGNSNRVKLNSISENIKQIDISYSTKLSCINHDLCDSSVSVSNTAYLKKYSTNIDYYWVSEEIKFSDPSDDDDDDDEDTCETHDCYFKFGLNKVYSGYDLVTNSSLVEYKWNSVIESVTNETYNGIAAGLVFEDYLNSNVDGEGTSSLSIDSYFTKNLLSNISLIDNSDNQIESSLYEILVSGYKLNDSNVYEEFSDLLLSDVDDDAYITKFKIKFLSDIPYSSATSIKVNYSSYLNMDVLDYNEEIEIINKSTFCNTEYMNDCLEADAVAYYKKVEDNSKFLLRKENYISSSVQNKDYTSVYDGTSNTGIMYYKVTLNEYSSIQGDIEFEDVLPSGTTLVTGNWSFGDLSCSSSSSCNNGVLMKSYSYKNKTESLWTNASYANVIYDSSTNKLSIDILADDLVDEDGYNLPVVLYYAVDVGDIGSNKTFVNTAYIEGVEDSTTRKLLVNSLDKSFEYYDSVTDIARFKIKLNENNSVLGDGTSVKLTDVLSYDYYNSYVSNAYLDSIRVFSVKNGTETDVTSTLGDFYTINYGSSNTTMDITLPDQQYYVIYVDYKLDFGTPRYVYDYIKNKVSITNNSEINVISDEVEGHIYEDSKFYKYSYGYDNVNNIASYYINVNTYNEKINDGKAYQIVDYLYYGSHSSYIESVELESIRVVDYSSGAEIQMPNDWYSINDTGSYYYIYMNGIEDAKDYKIYISYKINYKNFNSFSIYLYNYAYLQLENTSTSYDYHYQYINEISKMSKNLDGYNNKDNTLSYHIKFNSNAEILNDNEDVVLKDTLDYSEYTDVISGIKLDSIKVYKLVSSTKGEEVTLDDGWYSVVDEDNVLNIEMNLPDKNAYYIEYSYKFDFAKYDIIDISLENKLSMDGHSTLAVAGRVVENYKLYKESSVYDDYNNKLDYSVIINPGAETLLNGESLTLIDELDFSAFSDRIKSVKAENVKLYDYSGGVVGDEITNLEDGWYSESESNGIHTLTVNINDNTAYILKYSYKFIYDGNSLFDAELINSVYIAGVSGATWSDSVANVVTRYGSRASAITDAYVLTMTKADTSDITKTLAGAVYELEKYDGTTWVKLGKFTTDVNGKSLIGEKGRNGGTIMLMNHLYRLKEIEAPNGYRIDDSYAYIYNYNELFDNEYYPADFDLDSVKKLENNNIYVTDEKMEVNPNTSDVIKALLPFIILVIFGGCVIYCYRVIKE